MSEKTAVLVNGAAALNLCGVILVEELRKVAGFIAAAAENNGNLFPRSELEDGKAHDRAVELLKAADKLGYLSNELREVASGIALGYQSVFVGNDEEKLAQLEAILDPEIAALADRLNAVAQGEVD